MPWSRAPPGRGSVPIVTSPDQQPDQQPDQAGIDRPDLALSEPPVVGDDVVDAVVAALAAVVAEPLEDRLGVLETVHRTLHDRLADVEE